jgi:hypothetical protein
MESVQIVRRSSVSEDEYGEPVFTTTEIDVQALVANRTAMGTTLFEAAEISIMQGLRLFLPAGTEVLDDDVFRVRGKTYQMDGEAFDWRDGLGAWNPGVVVDLQKESDRG